MAERLSWAARALAAVGLLAVGGACALAMTSEADPDLTRAVADDELVVPVVAAASDGRLEVSVELSWQPGQVLRAPPGWAGIVTAVTPPADGTLDEGDRPFAVGGVDRIVIATTAPLVNPVKAGATGPDVLELRGALTRLGLLPPDSGGSRPERADNEFMRALAALGTSLRAPGTAPAFDPSWLIWTGGPAVTMDLLLEVGEAAPSAGTPIASEGVRLTSAAITQDPPLGGGEFVVSVDELDPVKLTGRAVVPEELAALGERLLKLGADPDSGDLRAGVIFRTTPIDVLRLQASAIGVAGTNTCVWLADGTPIRIEIVASQLGVSDLVPVAELAASPDVLAFPSVELRALC
ncbi:MAG TPA: hypothetical protein PK020_19450 [Ilumatobacteraceae bacterium]|nr:hypothetical protein [Ilumatobacteraceae bacterium]